MTTTFALETMRCDFDGPLARLRLNRPEVLNAANWQWVNDLVMAAGELARHDETRVVIVSGEGRTFCSGLDVTELAQGHLSVEWFATWERGMLALSGLDAITIAAVHGYCLGGGLQLAIACDLMVASSDAVFSIPAVREGVVADLGPMRLARQIGAAPAKRLCLLGHRFSAAEGQQLGLVAEVVEPSRLEERTLEIAHGLLEIPFTALRYTKRQIDHAFERDTPALFDEMVAAQRDCLASPEHGIVMARYREEQAAKRRARAQSGQ
jgi:enoyl-CoA hydratase/carnithine racemase